MIVANSYSQQKLGLLLLDKAPRVGRNYLAISQNGITFSVNTSKSNLRILV